jgi:hypothetical protein
MAYRLRKRESISKGLKRVTRDELRSAIACLTGARPSDDSIHAARKRIKKVRAVLQLVANAIDAGRAPRQCLGSAGHALSPIRDVEAVIETAQELCGRHGERLTAKTCAALGHTLESEKTRVRRAARRNHSIGQAVRSLRRVPRSTLGWDWKAVGASKLGSAIRRRYKKA